MVGNIPNGYGQNFSIDGNWFGDLNGDGIVDRGEVSRSLTKQAEDLGIFNKKWSDVQASLTALRKAGADGKSTIEYKTDSKGASINIYGRGFEIKNKYDTNGNLVRREQNDFRDNNNKSIFSSTLYGKNVVEQRRFDEQGNLIDQFIKKNNDNG